MLEHDFHRRPEFQDQLSYTVVNAQRAKYESVSMGGVGAILKSYFNLKDRLTDPYIEQYALLVIHWIL